MEKRIKRDYLKDLIDVMGTPDIKVIVGVRRSGKSVLLKDFSDYVKENIENSNLIEIDFNSLDFDNLRTHKELNDYVEAQYRSEQHNYLLIDEVQMCEGFERAINSLHNSGKYDIYVTGSNAFLQSSDLATLFVGRAYTIEIFPFSFKEFQEYFEMDDIQKAFDKYLKMGGFAGSYPYKDQKKRYEYINDIYETLIVRDIQQKYKIRDVPTLNRVSDFLIDNISNLTTGRNIAGTLRSDGNDTSHSTVDLYLKYLCDAFAFYKMKRYDVKGKAYLYLQDKYYLCDHAVKYARLGEEHIDIGQAYENIVAIELLRRGYEVYVGVVGEKEIDFVARRAGEKMYVQVSYDIGEEATFQREVAPLMNLRDAYPRLLIARTKQSKRDYEGVQIVDIAEWLTGE